METNDLKNYQRISNEASLEEEIDNLLSSLDAEGKKAEDEAKPAEAAVKPATADIGTATAGQDVKAADSPSHNGTADVSKPGEVVPTQVPTVGMNDKPAEVTPAINNATATAEAKPMTDAKDVTVQPSAIHDGEVELKAKAPDDSANLFKEQMDDIIAALKARSLNEDEANVAPAAEETAGAVKGTDVGAVQTGHDGQAVAAGADQGGVVPAANDAQVTSEITLNAGQDVKAGDSQSHNGPANAGEGAAAGAVSPAVEQNVASAVAEAKPGEGEVKTESVKPVKENTVDINPDIKAAVDAGNKDGIAVAKNEAPKDAGENKFYPECAKTSEAKDAFDADYAKFVATAGNEKATREDFANGWVCPVGGKDNVAHAGEGVKAAAKAADAKVMTEAEEAEAKSAMFYPEGVTTPDQKKAFNIAYFLAKRGNKELTRESFAKNYVVEQAVKDAAEAKPAEAAKPADEKKDDKKPETIKEDEAVVTPTAADAKVTDTVVAAQEVVGSEGTDTHDGEAVTKAQGPVEAPAKAAELNQVVSAAAPALAAEVSQPGKDVVAQDSASHNGEANLGDGEGCEGAECEHPEDDDYESIKEALMKGPQYFKDDDRRVLKLTEQLALVRAKDSGDILFEAMIEHATAAEKIRKRLCEKYGALASRQVANLLEDIADMDGTATEGDGSSPETSGDAAAKEAEATKGFDVDAQIKSGDVADVGTDEHADKVAAVATVDGAAEAAAASEEKTAAPAPEAAAAAVAPGVEAAAKADASESADDVKKDDVAGGVDVEAKQDKKDDAEAK